jgi:hypothetical protein
LNADPTGFGSETLIFFLFFSKGHFGKLNIVGRKPFFSEIFLAIGGGGYGEILTK